MRMITVAGAQLEPVQKDEPRADVVRRMLALLDQAGEIMVEAKTEADELIVHACDLDATVFGKQTIFDFARHRRIEHYGLICSQTGAIPPAP